MRRTLAVVVGVLAPLWALAPSAALACPPPPTPTPTPLARVLTASSTATFAFSGAAVDPFYYTAGRNPRPTTTQSLIPHLPAVSGYMQTNDTYRFVNIAEQVMTMVGEGKHGLWRIQDNGTVREYLRAGAEGLPAGADIDAPANLAIIRRDYSHLLVGEGFGGYKDPFVPVNGAGRLNFVDLPITHAKYGGKYDSHVPIVLPHWYCTMSENEFPNAQDAIKMAFAQPGANVIGPLGKRAGLDIKELYTNVLRLTPFPDARAWVNVGDDTNVDWRAVDTRKTKAEYYLYERPFFNVPYLFVTAVFDDANGDFSYVRPDGAYYRHLVNRGEKNLKTRVTLAPRLHIQGGKATPDRGRHDSGHGKTRRVAGTKLYGVHHPNRPLYYGDSGGGACPRKGGDWDGYPDTKGGAGWPTQYEEVTPVCDGVLIDIKFFANLDGETWNNPRKYLANAGAGTRKVTYHVKPGLYGVFVDPYHTSRGVTNPEAAQIGPNEVLRYRSVQPPVGYTPVP